MREAVMSSSNKLRSKSAPAKSSKFKMIYNDKGILSSLPTRHPVQTKKEIVSEETLKWMHSIEKRALRSEIKTFFYNMELLKSLSQEVSPQGNVVHRDEWKLPLKLGDCCKSLESGLLSYSYRKKGEKTRILIEETMVDKTSSLQDIRSDILKDGWSPRLIVPESRTGQSFRILQKLHKSKITTETEGREKQDESEIPREDYQNEIFVDDDGKLCNKNTEENVNCSEDKAASCHSNKATERTSTEQFITKRSTALKKSAVSTPSRTALSGNSTREVNERKKNSKRKNCDEDEESPQTMRNIIKSALWRSYKGTRYPPPVLVRKLTF